MNSRTLFQLNTTLFTISVRELKINNVFQRFKVFIYFFSNNKWPLFPTVKENVKNDFIQRFELIVQIYIFPLRYLKRDLQTT